MAFVCWSATKAAGQSPFPRSLNTATAVGAKVFIVGGRDAAGNALPMELYNLNTGMEEGRASERASELAC